MTLTADRTTRPSDLPPAPVPQRPTRGGLLVVTVLVRAVLALTVVGGVLAALQLVGTPETAVSSPPVLRTSYGLLSVGDVSVSAAIPGAGKGMVGKGHGAHAPSGGAAGVRVNVPVTLQNEGDAAVPYTPAQFRLDVGSGTPLAPQESPLLTGELRPDAAVALRLTFALPSGATSARLTVDGGRPASGLYLELPVPSVPAQQMTPQDQPAPPAPAPPAPAQPAPAPPVGAGQHGSSVHGH